MKNTLLKITLREMVLAVALIATACGWFIDVSGESRKMVSHRHGQGKTLVSQMALAVTEFFE